eukprot:1122188-Prymnesium_polylepis.1
MPLPPSMSARAAGARARTGVEGEAPLSARRAQGWKARCRRRHSLGARHTGAGESLYLVRAFARRRRCWTDAALASRHPPPVAWRQPRSLHPFARQWRCWPTPRSPLPRGSESRQGAPRHARAMSRALPHELRFTREICSAAKSWRSLLRPTARDAWKP